MLVLVSLLAAFDLVDPAKLAESAGLLGITAIVFAESGLLIGFLLPGDSLLFAAGILAAADVLPITPLILLIVFAAITGDAVGYWFGARTGPALFRRPNSRIFKHEHLDRARRFYDEYGGKTIVLARFIPIVRTFAPIVAGATGMRYRRFAMFNVVGGLVWGAGVPMAGYLLGNAVPDIDRYLLPAIALIVIASLIPIVIEVRRRRPAGDA